MKSVLVGSACAVLWFAVTAAASAQPADDRAQARGLADEAANSYARGDYVRADVLLERAYALVPAPTVALLRARALVRLNRWLEATRVYESASAAVLGPDSPEAFRRASSDAKTELGELEPRVPRLKINLSKQLLQDASVAVSLDGRAVPRARLDDWIRVDPRAHVLKLERNGRVVRAETVLLRERESNVVALDVPAPKREGSARTWGIVGIGAGGVALGLGVGAGIVALDAHTDLTSGCPAGECPAGSAGAEALDRFETFRTLSTVGYVMGVAGIGAGTIVLLTESDESQTHVAISPSLDGLRVRGSW